MTWFVVLLVMVAVMVVVPAVVTDNSPALLPPLPMVPTLEVDEVQVTAVVTSWLADMLAYA